MGFTSAKRNTGAETVARLRELVGASEIGAEGVAELEGIADLLAAQGYGPDRIVIDPGVVRGLGYYTGPVYEAEFTFEILDEKGRKRQFGSVAGGGRYDGRRSGSPGRMCLPPGFPSGGPVARGAASQGARRGIPRGRWS